MMTLDSLENLKARRQMCLEAIEYVKSEGRVPEQKMLDTLVGYDEVIARLEGRTTNLPSNPTITDDVPVTFGRQSGTPAGNQYGTFSVHGVTPGQLKFLRNLIETKVTDGVKIPTNLDSISKTAASALIDRLVDKPDKAVQVVNKPSDKQMTWIHRLLDEKDLTGSGLDLDVLKTLVSLDSFDKKAASKVLDKLFSLPDKPRRPEKDPNEGLEEGVYFVDGDAIKVYWNKAKDMLLAQRLNPQYNKDDQSFDFQHGFTNGEKWIYLGAAYRFVKPDQKITKEQALEYGAQWFICCRCGRELTDPNSIERSMGEWCASKLGF